MREKTIILAEDNERLRHSFADLIIRKGYTVIEAEDGQRLFEIALKEFHNLRNIAILSDTEMPEMEGYIACEKLLTTNSRYRKVMMIGMSDNPDNERFWEGIGIWQTFIYKHTEITNPDSPTNIAELLENRINAIVTNPKIYKLKNGVYRRRIEC